MNKIFITLTIILGIALTGCGGSSKVNSKLSTPIDLAILTLRGNTSGMTADQITELNRVMTWMDKDIITLFKKAGFNAVLIKSKSNYKSSQGDLLTVSVEKFNAGNRALRSFVGFGAGASSLDLSYKLYGSNKKVLKSWKDGVGSSKGGTYCAQTLNRNALAKVVPIYN